MNNSLLVTLAVLVVYKTIHVYLMTTPPILYKNQNVLHKMDSSASTMTTCCTIWICHKMIWFSTVIRYVFPFVSVLTLDSGCSTIHYWNQYRTFFVSFIMYVLWNFNWKSSIEYTPTMCFKSVRNGEPIVNRNCSISLCLIFLRTLSF